METSSQDSTDGAKPKPRSWLRSHWEEHGTKLLGGFEALIGLLEYVDQATINLVGGLFGPKYGPVVARGIQIGSGLLVARRGFMNSRRQ